MQSVALAASLPAFAAFHVIVRIASEQAAIAGGVGLIAAFPHARSTASDARRNSTMASP
jgi:hypothetical protein